MSDPAETIFALSSGAPPAAIAIVRVSGAQARAVAERLAGTLPPPRLATLRTLRDGDDIIDRGLLLWFPTTMSVTGEDLVEFHLHGGRAVVARLLDALGRLPGLRLADPGEFTRRGVLAGRMDLLQAEALADLLAAETESERRAALGVYGGALGMEAERWRRTLLDLSAQAEALLDHADESDVVDGASDKALGQELAAFHERLTSRLVMPPRGELREGARVVLAGPPNSGKSSLMNALAARDVALVTPIAGTTRDVIETTLAIAGRRFRIMDTAGLRETDDEVEAMGVARARQAASTADLLVWLGDDPPPASTSPVLAIHARCDLPSRRAGRLGRLSVSAITGEGVPQLLDLIAATAGGQLGEGELVLTARQHRALDQIAREVDSAAGSDDLLVVAEHLRLALLALDRFTGRVTSEAVLDTVFARFCIGK